jgi:hypothetical protein
VKYCPTEEMVSDFFTKPLQGTLFWRLRSITMNSDSHDHDHEDHRSVLKSDALGEGWALGWQEDSTTGPVPNAQRVYPFMVLAHGLLIASSRAKVL